MFSPWQHRGVYGETAQAKQLKWGTAGSRRGQHQGLSNTLEQGRFLQVSSCWVEQSIQTHPGLVTQTGQLPSQGTDSTNRSRATTAAGSYILWVRTSCHHIKHVTCPRCCPRFRVYSFISLVFLAGTNASLSPNSPRSAISHCGRTAPNELTWIWAGRLSLTIHNKVFVGFSLHMRTSSRSISSLISKPFATKPILITPHNVRPPWSLGMKQFRVIKRGFYSSATV